MDKETLRDLAKHQAWADGLHWKTLHENPALREDAEIRTRLNHILKACVMLTKLARSEAFDPGSMKSEEPFDALEPAMRRANEEFAAAIESADLGQSISLPRGPKGPFQASAGVILLQAIMHGQHHRGQNTSRMRALGVSPPMTDFIVWYAFGQPHS